jgi:hypothetical protein
MSLRVGYVNVRGLSAASWRACHRLLDHHFDYLFVAETWFIQHETYSRHRRFIASTTAPAKNLVGRSRGGVYLLGSHHARSKVEGVRVTEHSIVFRRGKECIAGVYFPPQTMDVDELTQHLEMLKHTTVLLGDINTRFKDPVHQDGEPGPPERLQTFTQFLSRTGHQHLKPRTTNLKLTTDHCLVRARHATLELMGNAALKMETDHRYTLSLTLGQGGRETTPTETIQRFRIGHLSKPLVQKQLHALISQCTSAFGESRDVDVMNAELVAFCQRVQEKTIGRASPDRDRAPPPDRMTSQAQTTAGSIRLYKQASQASDENDVIFPTPEAQHRGVDAAAENLAILTKRWTGQPFLNPAVQGPHEACPFAREALVTEIEQQEADKSCGADGIHIQFLKAVKETAVLTWLLELYNECLRQGQTPRAWNQSEIYLLSKDATRRRDAHNLRPISIICIFRKVFERLLLLRYQGQPWAQFHPAQAGFRRSYSTYSNAAVVHALLSSKARSTAVFLDFKSAFDVVDHQRLDAKLAARGCPLGLRRLIQGLMFTNLRSRVLINGQVTAWFVRTCGVLQGSPFSPWLFNVFVDDLLDQVNAGTTGPPICLFYADDGVILANARTDVHEKLRVVEEWTRQNAIYLNPAKCAIVTARPDLPPLCVYGQEISRQDSYAYLGFPITAEGVDFAQHLEQRITAAVGRARWLGVQSNAWGPAHRLRVYKVFLAPMFEYGAPLVWAWAQDHLEAFRQATRGFHGLMAWVSNTADTRYRVTANLCGLSTVARRFQRLRTAYQLIVDQMDPACPLQQVLQQANRTSTLHAFTCNLAADPGYTYFKETSTFEPSVRAALGRFLRGELRDAVQAESQASQLTALIPMESRTVPGLPWADIALGAPASAQGMLLQYRRGVFMFNSICACDPEVRFHRGHESCLALRQPCTLTRVERREKRKMQLALASGHKFTDIDYLLNTGQWKRAVLILSSIQKRLRLVYKEALTAGS